MFLSQASPKDFLGLILVGFLFHPYGNLEILSSVDFTEEKIVEKLVNRFTDNPYIFFIRFALLLILNPLFMRLYTDLLQH